MKWTDCNHLVSDSSILSHLETDHSITKANSKKIRISFNGFELPLGECDILFAPLIVTSMTTPLLIRSLLSIDGWIAFTCFILESARIEDSKEFQVKFCIESQKKVMTLLHSFVNTLIKPFMILPLLIKSRKFVWNGRDMLSHTKL